MVTTAWVMLFEDTWTVEGIETAVNPGGVTIADNSTVAAKPS